MVPAGSMNIAPPPLIRRTTVMPSRLASVRSTSLRSDWKLPMTTAGADHSQIRSVGGRRPAETSRARTCSRAMCSGGSGRPARMTRQSWSRQPLAGVSARGTAAAAAPARTASPLNAAVMRAVITPAPASAGMPVRAALSWPSTLGSGKKSPLTWTPASRPATTSTSAATSLPPGGLYSPCMMLPRPVRLGDGAADPDPPYAGAVLLVVPGVLARVLCLELVAQRLGVVVVDEHEARTRPECPIGGEDQAVPLRVGDLPHVEVRF